MGGLGGGGGAAGSGRGGLGTGNAGTGGVLGGGGSGAGGGFGGSTGSQTPDWTYNSPMDPAQKRAAFNALAVAARDQHSPSDAKRIAKRDQMLGYVRGPWEQLEDDDSTRYDTLKQAMDDAMSKILSEASVVHRTKHLDKLLDSGRISSLFEVGFSAGGDTPGQRALYEEAWFGKGHVPPVYSALEFGGVKPKGMSMYGTTKLYLKPEVRDRVTVTIGDSLMSSDTVFPGKPGDGLGLWANPNVIKNLVDPNKSREENMQAIYESFRKYAESNFIESQIHDGVILEDIEKVVFTQPPSSFLTDKLDKLGIPWEVES
ncbi:hypothetical protein [Mycobacterium phage C3]|nr:hypothetical protein [Mycobacterium phage C3]